MKHKQHYHQVPNLSHEIFENNTEIHQSTDYNVFCRLSIICDFPLAWFLSSTRCVSMQPPIWLPKCLISSYFPFIIPHIHPYPSLHKPFINTIFMNIFWFTLLFSNSLFFKYFEWNINKINIFSLYLKVGWVLWWLEEYLKILTRSKVTT